MSTPVCFLGFGEAAQSFCSDKCWSGDTCGFDIQLMQDEHSELKTHDFQKFGVQVKNNIELISGYSELVLSVVTADQALKVAQAAAPHLAKGSLYLDMNSAAPSTKQAVAKILQKQDVDYVDVAIMAPVYPKQLDVPLLLSGAKVDKASKKLSILGFKNIRNVGEKVGQASSIKMLRSVMIKGIEALTAECAIAVQKAGVTEEVFGSMGAGWLEKADYKLDRMMVHGERRAAEMEEVVKTLEDLGVDPVMSRGTALRQREIGLLGLKPPPNELAEKLDALNAILKDAAK